MQQLAINTNLGQSTIYLGESIGNLSHYTCEKKNLVIITDKRVRGLYGSFFPEDALVIETGQGEKNKTLQTVEKIYDRLVDLEADRSSFIVGIGGGIVCDITGYVASTFLRGLRFGFVSTTLLSQVDASIGGKNGVNFKRYKNMIGTFTQPEFVICDPEMLETLPEDEFVSGFAEIIKHACIQNHDMFIYLENNREKALACDKEVLQQLIYDSLVIKSQVVNQDEKEEGIRRILNFGHTFGHAYEKLTGISHGKAVGIGMVLAARLSVNKGLLTTADCRRIESLIQDYGLPTSLEVSRSALFEAMKKDKKREKENIHFILLNGIGNVEFTSIPISNLEDIINGLC
jgi:3-dehydroquinate synthase